MNIIKKWFNKIDERMEEKSKTQCSCCSGNCDEDATPKKAKHKKK